MAEVPLITKKFNPAPSDILDANMQLRRLNNSLVSPLATVNCFLQVSQTIVKSILITEL